METENYVAGRANPIRVHAEKGSVVTVNVSIQRHGVVDIIKEAAESRHNTLPNWTAAAFVLFLIVGAFIFAGADVHAVTEEHKLPGWTAGEVYDYPEYWGYGRM